MTLPSLSEVENASWEYLTTCATNWRSLAAKWEQAFTEVRNQSMHPGGTEWTGDAADAAQSLTDSDMMWVRNPTEQLRDAAGIAERGREQQEACRRTLVSTVEDVRNAGFNVAEDYHVTPTDPDYSSSEALMAQMNTAAEHEEFIKYQVARLVEGENDLSRQLDTATQGLDNFAFPAEEGDGGAGAAGTPQHATLVDDVKRNPTIPGPATVNGGPEQKHDDLGATIPGTGIRLGGDGVEEPGQPGSGYPRIHIPAHDGVPEFDGPNPIPVRRDANGLPLERPLPTGTAVGPNGERYGLFGIVPYDNKDAAGNPTYTVPNTVVVDLDHPNKILYTLDGVSQASGVFDPQSGRMVIVGNQGANGPRAMWESAPVRDNAAWGQTLQYQDQFHGRMDGSRESQIVALPGNNGYMLVGAGDRAPVEGVVAATPRELLTASPTELAGPMPDSSGKIGCPYGPTITEFTVDDQGNPVAHMRISTYTNPRDMPYNPETYDSTFTINP